MARTYSSAVYAAGPEFKMPVPLLRQPLDSLTEWRLESFTDLGFDYAQALALANAKGTNGFGLYWVDVKHMLDAGATHSQICAIFV